MSREEAIKILRYNSNVIHQTMNGATDLKEIEALDMAIQALSQINDIKAIINNPMYIQEDVLRYQMICEVVKE